LDGDAPTIATAIRDEVRQEVRITISAGIAPNKFLAKIASDWNKPDGQFVLAQDEIEEFLTTLPVKKLHGVGKVTAEKMGKLGIKTCSDLRSLSESELAKHFGSFGERLQQLSFGIDNRKVQTERIRKSVSVENTYPRDLPTVDACIDEIPALMEQLERRLSRIDADYRIHKQFIKIKFSDFMQTTVEMVSEDANADNYRNLCEDGFERGNKPVRLLGVGVRVLPADSEKGNGATPDQLALTLD
jgi:DNA polymerase-4